MSFFSQFSSRKPASKSGRRCQHKHQAKERKRRPLRLEALEDRTLLSAYIVTTTADSGPGSLRDAVAQINADVNPDGTSKLSFTNSDPTRDEIDFNITAVSDTGVATIAPLSALPSVTNAVLINGYTQAGATQNTLLGPCALGSMDSTLHPQNYGDNAVLKIVLSGVNVPRPSVVASGSTNGLVLTADNVTVQGLVINAFSAVGIEAGGHSDVIQGNFLGTDVSGTQALGNGGADILGSSNLLIGGTSPAARNIISAALNNFPVGPDQRTGGYGIQVNGSHATVQGNFIGTDVTGRKSLGNSYSGIGLYDDGNNLFGSELHPSLSVGRRQDCF